MADFKNEGERLSEQFKSLQENKQVLDWWQKQLTEVTYGYEGVSHTVNKLVADLVKHRQELLKEIRELKDTCEKLATERDESNATVGQLQADLVTLSERMDRMAEWAKKQQNKGGR